jgi:large subunit ribosomal protein L31
MKKDLHPELLECQVSCACGNAFTIKSPSATLRLDVCDKCHPFFTGSTKMVDAAGRIEKFKTKYGMK